MSIKKSHIAYDLDKINSRLEEMKGYPQLNKFTDDLSEAQKLIDRISKDFNGAAAGFTFSITGREALAGPKEKCRFCGEPK